jgi:hypothetical protein
MLRIINALVPKAVLPNNYNVANEAFQPGMFAQFKRDRYEIVCGVSDGLYSCGVIDDINDPNTGDNSTMATHTITVWPLIPGFTFQTDQVDGNDWTDGRCYVSKNGKITNTKTKHTSIVPLVGKMIDIGRIEVTVLEAVL